MARSKSGMWKNGSALLHTMKATRVFGLSSGCRRVRLVSTERKAEKFVTAGMNRSIADLPRGHRRLKATCPRHSVHDHKDIPKMLKKRPDDDRCGHSRPKDIPTTGQDKICASRRRERPYSRSRWPATLSAFELHVKPGAEITAPIS